MKSIKFLVILMLFTAVYGAIVSAIVLSQM
jgi:hypothetical protein